MGITGVTAFLLLESECGFSSTRPIMLLIHVAVDFIRVFMPLCCSKRAVL